MSMLELAGSYADGGRQDEALKLREETLGLRRKVLGPQHPETIVAMANLASSYFDLGRREEALKLREETLALSRKVNGPEHPETILIMNNLADSSARSGQWSKAVAEFSKLVELQPNNHLFHHSLAPLLVQSGDLEGYRRDCAQVLARFGSTNDPSVAEPIAQECLILPAAAAELEAIARLADTAVTKSKGHESFASCEFAKGLAEYRQAHFASAIEWMQKVLAQSGETYRDPQALLVLAMAQHHSGWDTEARASLAESARMIESGLPKLESGDVGAHWIDWIITHALLKEANELIEGPPATQRNRD
jgi:tetratricopeptide (TPR) repeat protein